MIDIKQVGGDHYDATYQHWHWAAENRMCYPLAAATKYLYRYAKKNGKQDLEKALSYLQFMISNWPEDDITGNGYVLFASKLNWAPEVQEVIDDITAGMFFTATQTLQKVIDRYVDPPLPKPNPEVVELEF